MHGGRVTTVSPPLPVTALLEQLRSDGFELVALGDRLRIRPADRITPELRHTLRTRKSELLALLTPPSERFVTLRNGLTLPVPVLRLAWSLEDRGFHIRLDQAGELCIEPVDGVTDTDRTALARWRQHLVALVHYVDEVVG